VCPPWRDYLRPAEFADLVAQAERAGFRFGRYRLEDALRQLLTEGE
jgi:hypothetical protein